jgi:hypothetical protein
MLLGKVCRKSMRLLRRKNRKGLAGMWGLWRWLRMLRSHLSCCWRLRIEHRSRRRIRKLRRLS